LAIFVLSIFGKIYLSKLNRKMIKINKGKADDSGLFFGLLKVKATAIKRVMTKIKGKAQDPLSFSHLTIFSIGALYHFCRVTAMTEVFAVLYKSIRPYSLNVDRGRFLCRVI